MTRAQDVGPDERARSVVLVHGAWHGPWCWDAVVPALSEMGIESSAVELPLTGYADDVAVARTAIESAPVGAVVCAHSYGGLVVCDAARGVAGIRRLVFLAALQVDSGEDVFALLFSEPTPLLEALVYGPNGLEVDPERVHELFYADSDPSLAASVGERLRPMHLEDLPVLSGEPAWRSVASTYVVCTKDKAISPVLQRKMATRSGEVHEWDTDHSPFLTRPRELAELLASYF